MFSRLDILEMYLCHLGIVKNIYDACIEKEFIHKSDKITLSKYICYVQIQTEWCVKPWNNHLPFPSISPVQTESKQDMLVVCSHVNIQFNPTVKHYSNVSVYKIKS